MRVRGRGIAAGAALGLALAKWGVAPASADNVPPVYVETCFNIVSTLNGVRQPICAYPPDVKKIIGGSGTISVLDTGALCDGVTSDEVVFQKWLTTHQSFVGSMSFRGPGRCLIDAVLHQMPPGLSLLGENGGGFVLPAQQYLTTDVLKWNSNASGITIKGLTFDGNGVNATGVLISIFNFNVLSGQGIDALSFDGNTVYGIEGPLPGAGLDIVKAFGLSRPRFTNNRLSYSSSTPDHAKAINLGSPSFPVGDAVVANNILERQGIFFGGLTGRFAVTGNTITGPWGFGGGIVAEPVSGVQDPNFKGGEITGNTIATSDYVPDKLGTKLPGIEIGFDGVNITGNSISDVCGAGINIFGAKDVVVGNTITGVGKCNFGLPFQAGIIASQTNHGNLALDAYVADNSVTDDGSGTTWYGFAALRPDITLNVGANDFRGTLGAHYFGPVDGVTFSAATDDDRVINSCFAIDQHNNGVVLSNLGGIGPDGWRYQQTAANLTFGQQVNAFGGCQYALQVTVVNSITPAAGDAYRFYQSIPLELMQDVSYGNPWAKVVVVGFCTKYSGVVPFNSSATFQNVATNRTYIFPYVISAGTNVRQCFSVPIPGEEDTGMGTDLKATAFRLMFNLGYGTNGLSDTPSTWLTGLKFGLTTDQPFVSQPPGTTLAFSQVRVSITASDNGWTPKTWPRQYAEAQRYYNSTFAPGVTPAQAGGVGNAACVAAGSAGSFPSIYYQFPVTMLVPPAITTFNPIVSNALWRNTTAGGNLAQVVPAIGAAGGATTYGALVSASAGATSAGDISCIGISAEATP